ncbi:MAG: hypothetical protein JW928_04295 [Candidatus Aureabacteria bacterium]|nr:hypothetical protein [Candidatus Auribacterota bacterium]
MPWYVKSMTVEEIISGKNEEIRRSFSYVYRMTNFRPKDMFLLAATKPDSGVELFISPSSVFHVKPIIDRYGFMPDFRPDASRIKLIVGDEREFKKLFP